MVWIIVQRGDGSFRGPPIENELITEDYVAVERGRNELDQYTSYPQNVDLTTLYRTGVRNGQVVRVLDSLQGIEWFGKIIGIRHFQDPPRGLRTDLTIERANL